MGDLRSPPNYLNPDVPRGMRRVAMPVVDANEDNLRGFGALVDDPHGFRIEIVRWPAQGWRPVDTDSGDKGGATRGVYIHPNIWHEGVFAMSGSQRFHDEQGVVHARVSIDFPREFGCLLEAPL